MQKFIQAEEPKTDTAHIEDRLSQLEAKLDLLIEQIVKIPADPEDTESEEKPKKTKKAPKSGFETLFE